MEKLNARSSGKKVAERSIPVWAAVLLGVWVSGCAFSDMTIKLPPNDPTTGYSVGEGRAIIVPVFVDQRDFTNRIGMKKNNYAMDTASVFADQSVGVWLSSRLEAELRAAGFQVIKDDVNPSATKIQGHMLKFFIEPVVQWTTVDIETDLSVRVSVTRPDGLEADRRYYVKGVNQALVATESTYVPSLAMATDALMKRLVPDIINLLNRFPETRARP